MRIVSYHTDRGPRSGVLRNSGAGQDEVVDLASAGLPTSVKALLEQGDDALAAAGLASAAAETTCGEPHLLAPVQDPQKIICVGLNYADHAAESGAKVGNEPVWIRICRVGGK